MSNPRLEELRNEFLESYRDFWGDGTEEDTLKEFELLLELEFLKRLAGA